jgi:hypothetical protein
MMKPKQGQNKQKQPYEKSLLRVIEMETDQVLGIGCKLATGPPDVGDPITCIGSFCSEEGS